ncbi:hypothetical protein IX289_000073 [Fusobacterium sp. DD1]|nr:MULTISPECIES: hypothetical protein [unclassified Fusobacterium]MBR8701170.1 hypothetical protein [Fusobacterium sp. DD45]MBR8803713.1 hypothetical protein [Fusobacterium sp. DD13]MBR8810814.1 hypothetical protein [Fusobacterium sp. DD14]MBR8815302.1 hypothetical protein [Fusobacterium sp. DD1]
MKFNGLTKVGREYLAKVTANKTPITFAKIKFGNGNLDEKDNPMTFTDIKSIKAEKSILKIEQHDDAVKIITQLDNVKLEQGYYPRETGIYVSDGDSEILYYYINDGEETSYLPPESNGPVRFDIAVNLIATSESVLTVRNDGKDLYITKDYFDNELNKKENVIEKKSAFNKDFGIEAGTVLEGNKYPIIENKFKGIVGNEINATFIQDSGQKTKGKFYLDRNTGKLYRCVNNTNSTTNSTDNFQDISLDTVSDKLDNLIKIEAHGNKMSSIKFLDQIFIYGRFINFERNIKNIIKLPFDISNHSVFCTSWHSKTSEIISINADVTDKHNLEILCTSETRSTISGFYLVIGNYELDN